MPWRILAALGSAGWRAASVDKRQYEPGAGHGQHPQRAPLRHATFYKAVYRPAVLRANRLTPKVALPPGLKFHALRHTYASLCIAAGRPALEVARFMGHAKPSMIEAVYAHLFNTGDHAGAMEALGAMGAVDRQGNVVPLHG